ncbi:MAG: hypothetical protein V7L20_24050 [Nostoc sp.]|uniref:hypothetical protein n=1 Tax=Nostoc sp. TaxID=1180 RepID=UPI002FF7E7CE
MPFAQRLEEKALRCAIAATYRKNLSTALRKIVTFLIQGDALALSPDALALLLDANVLSPNALALSPNALVLLLDALALLPDALALILLKNNSKQKSMFATLMILLYVF